MECSAAMDERRKEEEHKEEVKEHEQGHEQEKEQEPKPLVIVRLDTKGTNSPLQVAHAILARHNMPYGLLPMETLIECIYNPNDGRFKVTQPVHECDAVFGGHRIKLAREVSGRLLHNVIHELKGVRVKAAFLWLNIWNIEADAKPGKMIHFRAGPFNASMESKELWDYKFWAPAFKTKRKGGKGRKEGADSEEEEDEEEGAEDGAERERVDAAIEAAMPIGRAAEQFTHMAIHSKLHGGRAAGSIPRA